VAQIVAVFALGDLGLYLLLLVSGVLVPIWTIWLGTSLRGGPMSEPEVAELPGGQASRYGPWIWLTAARNRR